MNPDRRSARGGGPTASVPVPPASGTGSARPSRRGFGPLLNPDGGRAQPTPGGGHFYFAPPPDISIPV